MTKNADQHSLDVFVEQPDGVRVHCTIDQLADVLAQLNRSAVPVKPRQPASVAKLTRKPPTKRRPARPASSAPAQRVPSHEVSGTPAPVSRTQSPPPPRQPKLVGCRRC